MWDEDLPPPSERRIAQAQDIYKEIQEMDAQIQVWQMIIEYLSGPFIWTVVLVLVGIALIRAQRK